MSTELYMELPEDFLDHLAPLRREDIEPAELYALALSMSLNGWQDSYIETHTGIKTPTLRAYRKVGLGDYELPLVPNPHPDSPHINALHPQYPTSPHPPSISYITALTPAQVQELQALYQSYRAQPNFNYFKPLNDQPKWRALSRLAPKLMVYYSLGISAQSLTQYMTDYQQDINTATFRIIKGYYQWPTPSLATTNQSTFSSIYSPRISQYLQDLTTFLSPSTKNLESLSQTEFCTPFGKDLTLQRHLFRRTSYQQLFKDLPDQVTVLRPNMERHSGSFAQVLADVDLA